MYTFWNRHYFLFYTEIFSKLRIRRFTKNQLVYRVTQYFSPITYFCENRYSALLAYFKIWFNFLLIGLHAKRWLSDGLSSRRSKPFFVKEHETWSCGWISGNRRFMSLFCVKGSWKAANCKTFAWSLAALLTKTATTTGKSWLTWSPLMPRNG